MAIPTCGRSPALGLGANAPGVLQRAAELIPDQLRYSAQVTLHPMCWPQRPLRGIGEHSSIVRTRAARRLAYRGVAIDDRNDTVQGDSVISHPTRAGRAWSSLPERTSRSLLKSVSYSQPGNRGPLLAARKRRMIITSERVEPRVGLALTAEPGLFVGLRPNPESPWGPPSTEVTAANVSIQFCQPASSPGPVGEAATESCGPAA